MIQLLNSLLFVDDEYFLNLLLSSHQTPGDTVSAGVMGDNVTIRFETNNPGPWFLHCHKDPHLEAGLAVVLAEDIPGTTNDTIHPPDEWDELCDIYNELPENEH